MRDHGYNEYTCPACKEKFYLQQKGVRMVLCGEQEICYPPDENYKDPECSVYYFCSNECVEDLKIKVSACERQARWKQLMGKISKVSIEKGLAGKRIHDLDNIK